MFLMDSWIIITTAEQSEKAVYEYSNYRDAVDAYRKLIRAGRHAKIYAQMPVITVYIEEI